MLAVSSMNENRKSSDRKTWKDTVCGKRAALWGDFFSKENVGGEMARGGGNEERPEKI